MREGYRLDPRGEHDLETLVAPNGERVAWVVRGSGDTATINSMIEGIEDRHVRNGAKKREALADIAEEHYQLTTTRSRRFHDWRKEFFGDPIWGWLAFVIAAAVAVVGWMN